MSSLKRFASCLFGGLSLLFYPPTVSAIDNDPSLQMQLGNPSGATADTNNHSHYLIQRTIEAIDYNDSRGQANWASWDLTSSDANNAVIRQDTYGTDTNLPANFYRVNENEYSLSGYDRGHLCPSADRTDSTNNNNLTFLMSNMMPQAADNNRNTWDGFENYCRSLADAGNEMLIICGPSGFNGSHISSSTHVLIPSNTWKVAVVVPLGSGTAFSRITTTTNRVISIRVPNTNGVSPNWSNYVTSAHEIELETGLTFFTALPGTIASAFRAKLDNLTNPPPPGITSFDPGSGSVNTNVVITGTNFSGTTFVKFNGSNAVFIVDSSTQITAMVPTNAATGPISVTTPGGTATSSSDFFVNPVGTPDLELIASHVGSFTQGDSGRVLTIVVTNSGTGSSAGIISVSNALPPGLTATAISGTGWTSSLGTLTATRSDTLGVNSTFPPISITVNAAPDAPAVVTNVVFVSGGGETNLANNSASDVIDINTNTGRGIYFGTLVGWDVSGLTNYGPSTLAATTNAQNLTITGLTRGTGVPTNNNGAARAWGGVSFTNVTAANAVASNQFVTFSVSPNSGYTVSFTNIARFDYRRSSTGATNGLVQYQLNSEPFANIAAIFYTNTSSSGSSIPPIDLSGISELQNVGPGTNVTFRIVNWGGTNPNGSWYIFDVAVSTALDFAVQGVVAPIPSTPPPSSPTISLLPLTNNQVQFMLTGATGYNFAIEASTDSAGANWTSLETNASPFRFTDTNSLTLPSRFYRARFVP
jgi:endonuclease G